MAQLIKVLILGMCPADVELAARELGREGFKPQWIRIESERDFLANLDPPPAVILADCVFPDFDALRALDLLRGRELDIPFIILSGVDNEETSIAAMRAGAHDYILKDHVARLGPAVGRELREAEARRECRRLKSELAVRATSSDLFFSASPAGLCILDSQLRYVQVNETLAEMNGPPIKAHLGKTVREVLPKLAPTVEPILSRVLATGEPVSNIEICGEVPGQPGVVRNWVESYFPIPATGSPIAVGAVVVEITDRKRAEEKLRESEEKFRQLTENIEEVFWLTDPRTAEVVYVSPAYEKIWGRSRKGLYASRESWLDAVHPADRARVLETESKQVEGGGHDHVYRIVRPDGSIRWIRDRAFPVCSESGEVVRMAGIAEDVTQQKLAEEAVEHLLEQMSQTSDQMRRLSRQVVSAQEEERRRLSRELHDQAGQVLTALKMSLKSIQSEMEGGFQALHGRLAEAIASTEETMEQIRSLAHDLRPAALDEVGLSAALEGFCREFERRARVAIDYLGTEVVVPDSVGICLYRVLQEALTNVVRHAQAEEVKVTLCADDETVILRVEDDGQGFDAAKPGTGLGLVGMKERLELLGGQLQVVSGKASGTRLAARIPRRKNE